MGYNMGWSYIILKIKANPGAGLWVALSFSFLQARSTPGQTSHCNDHTVYPIEACIASVLIICETILGGTQMNLIYSDIFMSIRINLVSMHSIDRKFPFKVLRDK